MNVRVEKACGIDIHQAFLMATVLDMAGTKDTRRFSTCIEDLLNLREWLLDSKCQRVAIESTGIYWIPTYTLLEGKVETIVANPFHIKINQAKTSFKNRVHKVLSRAGIRISGVISDIFGKSGMIILNGILNGKTIDQKFKEFDSKINQSLKGMQKEMEILMSIPGVGFTTAAAIMAEIGNIEVFSKPKKLVGWSGLAPSINKSAGKSSNGHITKRGNKFLRTILVLAANSIAIGRPNKLRFFYERIKAKKGHKKAIVALARKLAAIIHHLLTFKEIYSEEEGKQKKVKLPKFVPVQDFSIDDMIGILCEAGYSVNKNAVKT